MERVSGGEDSRRLMALDFEHYSGREQAFVKHTFLTSYLPGLIGRVCSPQSRYNEFVYVDGFAGPWKSTAGEKFEDTSFGIALGHMTALRKKYLDNGHHVSMRAFLVEENDTAYKQLEQAVKQFPTINVTPLFGKMESHAAEIAAAIPSSAFSFTLIDPKGFPDIAPMMPLLSRQHAEALVNFMFDFANRFAGTELIPALETWLSANGNISWRNHVQDLSGIEREEKLERLAAQALQVTGGYEFSPVISVDKVYHDRTLYKLIFLTRHKTGLEVFRTSEEKTLVAQAEVRAAAKSRKRSDSSQMSDLFPDNAAEVAHDRSSRTLKDGRDQAADRFIECVKSVGANGAKWSTLWPPILQDYAVTRSWLGRHVNQLRKSGQIVAPGWPNERTQIPPDDQILIWAG
jgi:three-Cys-motif partner protein